MARDYYAILATSAPFCHGANAKCAVQRLVCITRRIN